MKEIELYRWEMASFTKPWKRVRTTHHLTREEALAEDPTAVPIFGSREVRQVLETEEEALRAVYRSQTNPK